PFTVTDAIQFIKDGGYSGNENASDKVYVEGEISQIKNSYDSEHESANYIISDGTNELEVYGGKYISGIHFNKEGLIKVGDEVIVYGQLTNYNGTYEFIANNYIYSLNGKTTVGADFDQTVPGGPWIYSHSFVAGLGGTFTIDNKTIDEALSYVWNFDVDYACMKASAYIEPTSYETESWLISPVIDLTSETSAYLTFEHATNFFNTSTLEDEATVWAKEDGTEGWSKLTGVTYPSSQGWTFVDAGDIDISSYAGKKIQIAFVYKSSSEKAGTWEVKNVVVKREADEVLPPVDVTEGSVILTFPDDNSASNGLTSGQYESEWEAKIGENTWKIYAFNNNNWGNDWTYIRCGRKSVASVATISTATAMPKLTAIDVTVDKITVSKVNSITLSIYSDATLSTAVVEGIEPRSALATGSMVFEIPAENQAADQYYKLTFDCPVAGSNGIIQISKVTYIAAE
ncbi:MAG: choice-of-anchor J domain-containing protein, partial [Bacteroidetes bacterium]|nr:choice-of-anchor J domain-containing protein [Candidatus Cryptobacteroides excrementavium]